MVKYFIISAFLVNILLAQQEECVTCHLDKHPNIVADWKISKHSENEVTCSTCHGDGHSNVYDVSYVKIPTPQTCAECHETQVTQYSKGKHALAWTAMKAMPTFHNQPAALIDGMKGCGGCHKIGLKDEAEIERLKREGSGFGLASCDACHTRHTFSKKEAIHPNKR